MQVVWCLDEMSKSSRSAHPVAVDPRSAIDALLHPDPGNVHDELVKRFAKVSHADVPKVEAVLQRLGYNQHLINKLFFKAPEQQRFRHQNTRSPSTSCSLFVLWLCLFVLLVGALHWTTAQGWFDWLNQVAGARSPWTA
jgi:hypothetical protein